MSEYFDVDPPHATTRNHHPKRELTVQEMLDDPIIQDVMRSDRVLVDDVRCALLKPKGRRNYDVLNDNNT